MQHLGDVPSAELSYKWRVAQHSALLTVKIDEDIIKLLAVDHPLSILANLPLNQVTDIALLTGKEFKVVYNSVSRLIIEIFEYCINVMYVANCSDHIIQHCNTKMR